MRRALPILLALAAAAAAALVANLVLLGYATSRNDPVGRLSPRAALITSSVQSPTQTRPATTATERTKTDTTTTTQTEPGDDHGGGGGGDD